MVSVPLSCPVAVCVATTSVTGSVTPNGRLVVLLVATIVADPV
jgi:hypothetical protein